MSEIQVLVPRGLHIALIPDRVSKLLQVQYFLSNILGTRNDLDVTIFGFQNICVYIIRYLGHETQVET